MEQNITGMSDGDDLPGILPNDIEEPSSAELAADLLREQATGPISLGPATPDQEEDMLLAAALLSDQATGPISLDPTISGVEEDTVLIVETAMSPEEMNILGPEDTILDGIDLEMGAPWYRSRWLYLGAGLLGGTALAVGTAFLIRGANNRKRRAPFSQAVRSSLVRSHVRSVSPRTQGVLSQWSNQLSGQASKLTGQTNKLAGQASKLTGQVQGQLGRLARRTQGTALNLKPLQRQASIGNLAQRAQSQLSGLSKQASGQLSGFSKQASGQLSSIGSATRATTTQAISKAQANLAQARAGVAIGADRTRRSVRRGWKFSRNFSLGMAAGALWAAFFTPESGEATRQHLTETFRSRSPMKQ